MKEGKNLLAKLYNHISKRILQDQNLSDDFKFNVEFSAEQFNSINDFLSSQFGSIDSYGGEMTVQVLGHELIISLKPEITSENIDLNDGE